MTKNEIKLICETDGKLQWWAMVLFAEISELIISNPQYETTVYSIIQRKIEEFPQLVIQRQIELAQEKVQK